MPTVKKKYYTLEELKERGLKEVVFENGEPTMIIREGKDGKTLYGLPSIRKGKEGKFSKNQRENKWFQWSQWVNVNEYVRVQISAADLVWLWNGYELEKGKELDHINRDALDNRIENLRLLTHQENLKNRKCVNQYTFSKTEEELKEKKDLYLGYLIEWKRVTDELKKEMDKKDPDLGYITTLKIEKKNIINDGKKYNMHFTTMAYDYFVLGKDIRKYND